MKYNKGTNARGHIDDISIEAETIQDVKLLEIFYALSKKFTSYELINLLEKHV